MQIALATPLLAAYNPPATYAQAWGVWEVPCNATAPGVAFTIGGVNFEISPADLIFQSLIDPITGLCATGIQPSTEPYILGDSFMNNVLTTFDLGALQMRFTALA
jgi:Eukaryotic aspartyl protease